MPAVLWLGRPLILHSQQALDESSSPHPSVLRSGAETQAEDSTYARMEVEAAGLPSHPHNSSVAMLPLGTSGVMQM